MKRLQSLAAPACITFGSRSIEAHGTAVRLSGRPDTATQHVASEPPSPTRRLRSGMTIIEVLIATAMTLLIMLALAQGFKTLSDGVTAGRARLTHSDQLRGMSGLLKSDLNGLTVTTNTLPQTQQSASGYFMIYDGPISDSTAMLFNYLPNATLPEERLSASRWSDIDDTMAFTAKAKDGEWFRGRIPLALMKIHQAKKMNFTPTISEADWLTDVAIASEYAEIVWFMRPLNDAGSLDMNENAIDDNNVSPTPPVNSVVDQIPVLDCRMADLSPGQDGVPDPDGMPDRIALCRRVLLIRPDLDITPPSNLALLTDYRITARPTPLRVNDTNTFRYQMRFAYQRMDVSVRPKFDPVRNGFVLETNSLADLQLPENRFAHFVMPTEFRTADGNSFDSGPAATLPILALTPEDPSTLNAHYVRMTNLAFGNLLQTSTAPVPANPAYGTLRPADRGFIPAAFMRVNLKRDSNSNLVATPTLEEVVASNVVGFDIRGFDPTAQLLTNPGADGAWGIAGYDDDGSGNPPDNRNEAGWPGTDDLIVGPSDPGYALMLRKMEAQIPDLVVANSGAFVDLGWGRKVVNQIENAGMTHTLTGTDAGMTHFQKDWAALISRQSAIWSSSLSGFEPMLTGGIAVPTLSLRKAGRVNIPNAIYQPVYDTFTDYYESDGSRQEFGISADGLEPYGGSKSAPPPPSIDMGTNGWDDPVAGVSNGVIDDDIERETSPPFRMRLPSVQIKFRVQDQTAGTLQELSMVHDLTGSGN